MPGLRIIRCGAALVFEAPPGAGAVAESSARVEAAASIAPAASIANSVVVHFINIQRFCSILSAIAASCVGAAFVDTELDAVYYEKLQTP